MQIPLEPNPSALTLVAVSNLSRNRQGSLRLDTHTETQIKLSGDMDESQKDMTVNEAYVFSLNKIMVMRVTPYTAHYLYIIYKFVDVKKVKQFYLQGVVLQKVDA